MRAISPQFLTFGAKISQMATKNKVTTAAPAATATLPPTNTVYWILLGVALLVVLFARLSLLGIPLERDEGGYAYIGERLFGSQRLYTDMLDIKLPGLYFLYWLFNQLPGGQEKSIHLGLLLMHAGALYVFFRWVKQVFQLPVAALSTALFAISAVLPGVFGFAAHATQLIQLPVMGALWMLWNYTRQPDSRRWWQLSAIGLLLGFAFTVKQPAVVFIVFAIGALLLGDGTLVQKLGRAFVVGISSVVPFAAIAGYFYAQGRFDDFWLWTFVMPTAQTVSADDTWFYLKTLVPRMVGNHGVFWVAGLLSLVLVPMSHVARPGKIWAVSLLLLSILSACIGLGFMPHYFIPAIPWAALGISISVFWMVEKFGAGNRMAFVGVAAAFIGLPILLNAGYLFRPNYPEIMEQCYHWNGFAEAKAIATELKKRLKPGERVAILGSEPQINFYTGTEHCSPQLYMYPVIREHKRKQDFQQQFLRNLNDCNAEYVVVTASEASWMPGFAEMPFFKRDLFPKISAQYDLIGRANIGQIPMNIVWDEALKTHNPPKCPPMFVFRKKGIN
jgi:hypothetical protein